MHKQIKLGKNNKQYHEKKKSLSNIVRNTPLHSDAEPDTILSVRRQVGRKTVWKERAKIYRKLKKTKRNSNEA